eukprot:1180284-Prorocentrum_minimum.AAC.3
MTNVLKRCDRDRCDVRMKEPKSLLQQSRSNKDVFFFVFLLTPEARGGEVRPKVLQEVAPLEADGELVLLVVAQRVPALRQLNGAVGAPLQLRHALFRHLRHHRRGRRAR